MQPAPLAYAQAPTSRLRGRWWRLRYKVWPRVRVPVLCFMLAVAIALTPIGHAWVDGKLAERREAWWKDLSAQIGTAGIFPPEQIVDGWDNTLAKELPRALNDRHDKVRSAAIDAAYVARTKLRLGPNQSLPLPVRQSAFEQMLTAKTYSEGMQLRLIAGGIGGETIDFTPAVNDWPNLNAQAQSNTLRLLSEAGPNAEAASDLIVLGAAATTSPYIHARDLLGYWIEPGDTLPAINYLELDQPIDPLLIDPALTIHAFAGPSTPPAWPSTLQTTILRVYAPHAPDAAAAYLPVLDAARDKSERLGWDAMHRRFAKTAAGVRAANE